MSDEAKEVERAARPLIAVPGEGWDLEKIQATLRDVDGAEGFEVWGKRLMLRVQLAHEPAARLHLTGKEHAPTDLLWRMSGVPHIKQARIGCCGTSRRSSPFGSQGSGCSAGRLPMWWARYLVRHHGLRGGDNPPDHPQAPSPGQGPSDRTSPLLRPAGPLLRTGASCSPRCHRPLAWPSTSMRRTRTWTSRRATLLLNFLVSRRLHRQAPLVPWVSSCAPKPKHSTLVKVATELTESAQHQLRQVIDKNAEDAAAQQRWIELAVDNKLASFQKALTDQQATWELAQDRKLPGPQGIAAGVPGTGPAGVSECARHRRYQASGSHGPDGFDDGGVAGSWAHGGEEGLAISPTLPLLRPSLRRATQEPRALWLD